MNDLPSEGIVGPWSPPALNVIIVFPELRMPNALKQFRLRSSKISGGGSSASSGPLDTSEWLT